MPAVLHWLVAVLLPCCLVVGGFASEKIPVVTSFTILAEWVERVGGDAVTVTSVVGRGGDTHVYAPTPRDAVTVAKAQLLVMIGQGYEPRIEALAAPDGPTKVLSVSEGLPLITHNDDDDHGHGEESHKSHDHDHGHDQDQDQAEHGDHADDAHGDEAHEAHEEHADEAPKDGAHGDADEGHKVNDHDHANGAHSDDGQEHDHEVDPHLWQDPSMARLAVARIRDALIELAPDQAQGFRERAAAYDAELAAVDAWIKTQVATVPEQRRVLVTGHDSFGYFARAYGFTVLGQAVASLSTQAADASPKELMALIALIKEAKIPAVFGEQGSNNRLVSTIAREAGVTLVSDLASESLGPVGSATATYSDFLRHNTTRIVTALAK